MNEPTPEWANQFRAGVHTFIEHYHRHEIEADAPLPDEPCLIIGNHGFGGVFDLNVIAMSRALASLTDRPLLYLVHQIAWTLGTGRLVEALGCKPACATNAAEGFAASQHVVVFPGGDLDAAKPWSKRNQIQFGGRAGYARLAMEHGVPIVPVVTASAGESLFVLSDGQGLAARLGLHKYGVETLPVSVSLPWGINVGVAGILPYLPLPAKLSTAVLPAMRPEDGEDAAAFAYRVESTMQARLDDLAARRRPLLG
jgi:1-acyl-sn-glycerol-3-phosphate acyltransferase